MAIPKLANLTVGRKLGLLVICGLGPTACVVLLTLWGLGTIRSSVGEQQSANAKMQVAQNAAADMGRVNSIVGHIALGSQCESCHGVATGGDREHQANLVKEYLKLLSDLKARETDGDGRQLVAALETAGNQWHEINSRVLELSNAQKKKEAAEAYRSESIPGYAPVDQALQHYLTWLRPREAAAVGEVNSFTRRLPVAVGVLALVGIGFSLFLGLLVRRSITNPLRAMQDAAGKLARGDVNISVELESEDELGALSESFRVMAEVIQKLISETEMLTKAAVAGKLETRGNAEQFHGGYREIVTGINDTLNAVIGPLNIAAQYVDRISKGDIPPKITETYRGDFNEIKNHLNNCIDGLNGLVEANAVLKRMSVNDYTRRVEGDYAGVFAEVAASTNEVRHRLLSVVATFKNIARGDLSQLPEFQAIGRRSEQDELVPSIVVTLETLTVLVADTAMLAQAAVEGRLATRADADQHRGDFRKIVEGINSALDAVVKPIRAASVVLGRIAAKDLNARVEGDYQGDYAQLKEDINRMVTDLQENMRNLAQNAQTLSSSSEEMSVISQQMAGSAEETAIQANVVSSASEEVSRNVETVASGAEQMQASIREIAKNSNESARVAKNAVGVAQATNVKVSKLGESSQEIGNVIKVITSIAEQTNLLALNATIEAARAGEAGKGFAVVANEVKELAMQTAKATEEISQKIGAIQTDTKQAVQAIGEIGAIINQINDISNSIASAVEEQTVTTNEIGRNVAEAAKGTSDIAKNISGVADAAKNTTNGAGDTQRAAQELSQMATQLQGVVAKYRF